MTETDPQAPRLEGDVADYQLGDRYEVGARPVLLTGVQAIARALIEQRARDRRAGVNSATFVSGYQGSPLGGLDTLLAGIKGLDADHAIRLSPGVNEELASTAVWGSQQTLPTGTRTVDGVVGVWYGKGPGLDRASDSIRHANMYGCDPRGGVVAYVGDDPACKSSTLPFASDATLAALNIPFLYPRNAEEIVEHTLMAVELSRLTGCWVAIKIVADVADGLWTLDRDFSDLHIVTPESEWDGLPWTYRQRKVRTPGESLLAEADLLGPRWNMVQAFLAANDLDRVQGAGLSAKVGIIAAGTAYDSALQALEDLGLTGEQQTGGCVRSMRIAAPFPLSSGRVRDFAEGLEKIVVIEEKGGFLESQVKDVLFHLDQRPTVLGKRDEDGRTLIPAAGELGADRLQGPLRRALKEYVDIRPSRAPRIALSVLPTQRTPYFCSGCPHNRSTVVPDGSIASGGIGCHTLASVSSREDAAITGWTQMGGEGAQWIGQSAFTDVPHIFQNIGDGTFFHSGQLAIQASIAAGVNVTYKVLYNSAVAMTGAQDPQAGLPVPALTRKLVAEGVRQIIICADEPERYRGVKLAKGTTLWPREKLDEAQRRLRDVEGVTVLIYDQQCAANARRLRKRGKLPARPTRVIINQAVCEGCGDCGVKSNCLSVQPVETEFGRKTQIDQASCNTDYSCLEGDCPSFVTLQVGSGRAPRNSRRAEDRPIAPRVDDVHPTKTNTDIFLAGIGGTGILTVNQLLATAAMRAGYLVDGLDQTGLSQKAGPVVSHLRIATGALPPSNRVGEGSADVLLAFDLLVASDAKYAKYAGADRTVVVASTSKTPTGDMVFDKDLAYPEEGELLDRMRSRSSKLLTVDALGIAQRVLGSTTAANLLLVGMAFQMGSLPIPAEHLEEAIRLNGVAVDANIAAFRWGRALAVDPDCLPGEGPRVVRRSDPAVAGVVASSGLSGETLRLVHLRAQDLVKYQSARLAHEYVKVVTAVWSAEREVGPRTEVSEAAARYLYKLMAYKDEYEIARLLTDPDFIAQAEAQHPDSGRLTYNLHPPFLRALGMKKKISLGPWTRPFLRALAHGRRLRGTPFDPFGPAHVRRVERRLVAEYRTQLLRIADTLSTETYETALALAEAPDLVRGYESIKLSNIDHYWARVRELAREH